MALQLLCQSVSVGLKLNILSSGLIRKRQHADTLNLDEKVNTVNISIASLLDDFNIKAIVCKLFRNIKKLFFC